MSSITQQEIQVPEVWAGRTRTRNAYRKGYKCGSLGKNLPNPIVYGSGIRVARAWEAGHADGLAQFQAEKLRPMRCYLCGNAISQGDVNAGAFATVMDLDDSSKEVHVHSFCSYEYVQRRILEAQKYEDASHGDEFDLSCAGIDG